MPPERTDMKKSRTRKKIQTMHDWLMTPVGQYILGWEESHFQTLSADIFGFNAVQIGFPEINTLQENRMTNRWYTHPFMPESEIRRMQETGHFSEPDSDSVRISLVHNIDELPFASESVDLIVLPHAFEFARSPHQILREVNRVLIPEGQVIISGFNPASLWGIRQHFSHLSGNRFLPEYAEFLSLSRLKDWLKLLNFEISRGYFGCYRPPCRTRRWLRRFAFMEKTGNRWWPYLGAVYLICAIKRVHGVHLINPAFRKTPGRLFQTVSVNRKSKDSTSSTSTDEMAGENR
jgi:SAM-dependent methyltransferase